MRIASLAVAVALGLTGTTLTSSASADADAGRAQRSEAEDYKDVPNTIQFVYAQSTSNPSYCVAAVFVPFTDIKGWDPLNAHVETTSGSYSQFVGEAPDYYDTYTYQGVTFTAPAGSHWTVITAEAKLNNPDVDCSDVSEAQKAVHKSAYVTYKIIDECDFRRDDLREAQDDVKKAKKKVENSTGQALVQAKAKLKVAKKALKKAKKKFKKKCTL